MGRREDFRVADYDAGRVEVVVEGLAFAEKLRGEEQVELFALKMWVGEELEGILDIEATGVTHWDCRLYHHHRVRVDAQHQVNHVLDAVGVEVVLLRVVICRCCYDNEIRVFICCCAVKRRCKIQLARDSCFLVIAKFATEVFFDVIVLNRADAVVDFFDFFRDYVHGCHLVVLREQSRDAQAHITGSGNSNLNIFKLSHILSAGPLPKIVYRFVQNRP